MAKLHLSHPGMSFSISVTQEVLKEYLKMDVSEMDLSQKLSLLNKIKAEQKKYEGTYLSPMRAIQTPWAETALWMAAEQSPNLLRKWAQEKPSDLLELIEDKVVKATRWKEVAVFNGADEMGSKELMIEMMAPFSPATEPNQVQITEQEMEEIQNILLSLIKK